MYVKQNVAILFLVHPAKMTKDCKAPIYTRLTIVGLEDAFSTGLKISPDHWDNEAKKVRDTDPAHAALNKRLRQILTDLERTVDLIQAREEIATPVPDELQGFMTLGTLKLSF